MSEASHLRSTGHLPTDGCVGVTPVLAVVLAMAALTDCALRWPAEQNARDDGVVADGDDVVRGT